jgi:hypothetical protein
MTMSGLFQLYLKFRSMRRLYRNYGLIRRMIKACIEVYRKDRQIKSAIKVLNDFVNSETFQEYIILHKYNSILSKVHVYSRIYRFRINRRTYALHMYIDEYNLKLNIVYISFKYSYKKALIKIIKTCFLTLLG